ncbi:MAG: substrate-binding domain-containing protein [Hyphomicrobiales bacterium]|nr:substrate-binding domain-containing protein [Hyphomicrobiales bacterium]
MHHRHIRLMGLAICAALAGGVFAARAQNRNFSVELVDPKAFRVCADPNNLPFSNEKGEGFENKLAELFAAKLGKPVVYTFYPQATGFVRNTLGANRCDVIMNFPQGDDLAQPTNPYYRTAYALIFRPGTGFDDLVSLDDPRLKGKKIGAIANTPPVTNLAINGLLPGLKSYALVVDTRFESPTKELVKDVESGAVDVGLLWGPIAGYYARQSGGKLSLTPLVHEKGGPPMTYRMGLGVRHSDQEWKRQLNTIILQNQGEINAVLQSYGVPLLDEQNKPLARAK